MSDGFPWAPWRMALEHPQNAVAVVKATHPDGYEVEAACLYGGVTEWQDDSEGRERARAQRDRLATLIAAAPDMYAALRAMHTAISTRDNVDLADAHEALYRALRKADGPGSWGEATPIDEDPDERVIRELEGAQS